MSSLESGQEVEVQGSGKKPYIVKRIGEVYSCSCPAWLQQSQPINKRTCKHLRRILGDEFESNRIGGSLTVKAAPTKEKVTNIPPDLLLAHVWTPDIDPTGWWYSEKMDGVRALFTGERFISRLGNEFFPPSWFTSNLPKDTKLDGELWIGRKKFQETVSVVRTQGLNEEWKQVKYIVFDLPDSKLPFEERLELIGSTVKQIRQPHVGNIVQHKCLGIEDLRENLSLVESRGGEGLMLRQPGSLYEGGRSNTLLKVKSFFDAEAVVVGHTPGTGKHKGRVGALELDWNGTKFKAGTGLKDKDRENPPPIGSVVTFRYTELTKDKIPRFPVYLRIKTDSI